MPNERDGAAVAHGYGARTRSFLNNILEMRRDSKRKRFEAKISSGYSGPIIVAEGDSWFEYPNSEDLLVRLGEKYAVLGLAKAGDSFSEVTGENDELFQTLKNPPRGKDFHIVMLSLGGNEVMGHIEDFVHEYEYGRPDEKYILPEFRVMLEDVKKKYNAIIQRIINNGTQHVILHGYDYPDPRYPRERDEEANGAQWIGPPLNNLRNIGTITTYRCIANMLLDDFNAMLIEVANRPEHQGRVHYVRLLGTIGKEDKNRSAIPGLWVDEIHGSNEGFKLLAKKFEPTIDQVWVTMQQA